MLKNCFFLIRREVMESPDELKPSTVLVLEKVFAKEKEHEKQRWVKFHTFLETFFSQMKIHF